MKLKFINQNRGRGTWKFNNSLLTDIEFVNKETNGSKSEEMQK
jgi:molybdate-binding protein